MNATFSFDGTTLRLRLSVEGTQERAVAELMEKFCVASVSLDRGRYSSYDSAVQGVDIVLREPAPTPENTQDGSVHYT